MQQLSLDGMPRRLYTCTPTRLMAWLDCPRRYRMTYLDRPTPGKGPPWAHYSVGASVHNALAGWWRLPRAARTVAAAGDLLDAGWISAGFADSGQADLHRRRARQMVERYVAGLDPADEPAGVERTVATKTDLIAVSGRIDRLDIRDELVVVDYKTGRQPLTVDAARSSMALALYALAAAHVLRRPCRRVELHHLPTGGVLAWEHTDESLARHLRRAQDVAAECQAADERYRHPAAAADTDPAAGADADPAAGARSVPREDPGQQPRPGAVQDAAFPPRPGSWCGWCDYRAHCPEGRQAAPHRQPWDGLATDDPAAG